MFLAKSVAGEVSEEPYKAHILLVDDEWLLCEGLRLALQEVGYEVTTAVCGREAKERMSSCYIDIVLLDVGLPDVDGFALCAELRKRRDVPVIMLSGLSNINDVLDGYHSGATDFVSKPFQLRILIQHIETALHTTTTAGAVAKAGPIGTPATFRGAYAGSYGQGNDKAFALNPTYTGVSQPHVQSVIMPKTMVSSRF
jgi:DNA-binding response OmpR family regulator